MILCDNDEWRQHILVHLHWEHLSIFCYLHHVEMLGWGGLVISISFSCTTDLTSAFTSCSWYTNLFVTGKGLQKSLPIDGNLIQLIESEPSARWSSKRPLHSHDISIPKTHQHWKRQPISFCQRFPLMPFVHSLSKQVLLAFRNYV